MSVPDNYTKTWNGRRLSNRFYVGMEYAAHGENKSTVGASLYERKRGRSGYEYHTLAEWTHGGSFRPRIEWFGRNRYLPALRIFLSADPSAAPEAIAFLEQERARMEKESE